MGSAGHAKKVDKGLRELKKLQWDVKDGVKGEADSKSKRNGRGGLDMVNS